MPEYEENQERTEQATPRRREEARKKGQVAKSREVSSVAVLLAALMYFYFQADVFLRKISGIMIVAFRDAAKTAIDQGNIHRLMLEFMGKSFFLLFPFLLLLSAIAFLGNFIQVGWLFSMEAIKPDWNKIDPVKGWQRLFSFRALIELIKNILKMIAIILVAYLVVKNEINDFMWLMDRDIGTIVNYLARMTFKILFTTSWLLVILALLDYLYQRWEYEKGLKMSRQEIKEEFKNTEGDPAVKARIRRLQREMARRRMMAEVPKADVVITNPTHLACALRYERDKHVAPELVAKGRGYIAEKIREIAEQSGVPVVENKPLAQVLYKLVKINEIIPEELYQAVAEVLAYVYNIKKRKV